MITLCGKRVYASSGTRSIVEAKLSYGKEFGPIVLLVVQ